MRHSPDHRPACGAEGVQARQAAAQEDVGARVSKKLATEEKLIATYGGVRVKMDIERYDLWTDRHDIAVSDLWATYARFPHMPRVSSFAGLADAISDGTSNMNWKAETFGYADAHDGDSWVGVSIGQHVTPNVGGLLIHPDHVPSPKSKEEDVEEDGSADGDQDEPGTKQPESKPGGGAKGDDSPTATQFYAVFDIDSVRGIKQLGEILEHVTGRLGPDVELSLEIRATSDAGYDDGDQRVVSENARNLGATAAEFE